MDLFFYELTIFTNAIINNEKYKIDTNNFGPFDNIKKANIYATKKIDEIKSNTVNMKNIFKTEFELVDVEFEYDFIIKDITNEELS